MSGAPVTVVSGPPGTGKSQVIVSALLNAWALGKTVLFASQNNKAVDVVIERVRKFEQDFPILVRAGAKKNSNIASVLMDVQGYAAQTGAGSTAAVEDERIKTRLDEIQRQLDSKVPQRISDARTAAFRAACVP
jgi:KaiC/GvpD/RAD55 family RecA-like ATPase